MRETGAINGSLVLRTRYLSLCCLGQLIAIQNKFQHLKFVFYPINSPNLCTFYRFVILFCFLLQFICSYLLWPFAWIMGTPFLDCKNVATLIGIKTFTNEFIAYENLAKLIKNRGTILDWRSDALNQTVNFDSVNNCYTLMNSTLTDGTAGECLSMISVSLACIQ